MQTVDGGSEALRSSEARSWGCVRAILLPDPLANAQEGVSIEMAIRSHPSIHKRGTECDTVPFRALGFPHFPHRVNASLPDSAPFICDEYVTNCPAGQVRSITCRDRHGAMAEPASELWHSYGVWMNLTGITVPGAGQVTILQCRSSVNLAPRAGILRGGRNRGR